MTESYSSLNSKPILIGPADDTFSRNTIQLLRDSKRDFILCQNIYLALAKLAPNNSPHNFVIGTFRSLTAERGRFLRIISKKSLTCLCYSPNTTTKLKDTPSLIIINTFSQLEKFLNEFLLSSTDTTVTTAAKARGSSFNKDDFAATKSEIDALLGST